MDNETNNTEVTLNAVDAFHRFSTTPEQYEIKALGGATVTIRKLTLSESQRFNSQIVKNIDANGKPEMDFAKIQEMKLQKISLAMTEPKMTEAQLGALSTDAKEVIDELYNIISPIEGDIEGN